jgi:hypothetical protein
MPTVFERISVSVDTGDLDQRVGAQIAQIQQIVELVVQLAQDPPDDVGDLLDLAGNLPLPEFDLDGDFSAALGGLGDSLPADLGDITGSIDGDLAQFGTLLTQLQDVLQDSVRIAAAVERLVAIEFSCPGGNATGPGGGGGAEPPPDNPAADRMTRTAEQTQQVNDLLDRLPASPTVGGLLEFFFPIIDHKRRNKFFQLTLPVIDDIVEPLRTLSRWAALDANAVGGEIEATLALLALRLRNSTRLPLDALLTDLGTLQASLELPALTTFADAYATALDGLVVALEGGVPADTAAPVAAVNQALDDASITLDAWNATVGAETENLIARLDDLPDTLLDRSSHLLTLLEPVELPAQLVDAIPTPEAPDPEAVAAVQEAVQPIIDWLGQLVGLLDFSSIQGPVSDIADDAQGVADAVQNGLTGVAVQVQGVFDQIGEQLEVIDLNGLRTQLETQIDEYGGRLERELGTAFSPAADAVTAAVQTLSDALDNFDPEDVVDALRGVLEAITGVLESGEVADAIGEIQAAIAQVTGTLEGLSFSPLTDEVVDLIEQMTEALKALEQTDMNDAAKAALSVALQVLPDDLTPVTDPLLEEFDELIEQGPVPLLERVAEKPAALLDTITGFEPGALIGDSLGTPYREALETAEAFRPSELFEAIDGELQKARDTIAKDASPGRALQALQGPFDALKQELERYSPDTLIQPLEDRIEAAVAEVIEASPVDEIFAVVDRIFAVIENALAVPQNLVATLERLDTLLADLADSDNQVDAWRDGLLDKVFGVTNIAAISAALADLNSALADAAHSALLDRFDTQSQALVDALSAFGPGSRLTSLATAYNRAQSLAAAMADSPEKTAVLAALDRFDPGRASPLRLGQQLEQALAGFREAFVALQAEWQELLEDPEGLLAEMAAVTADADGLRTLVANAIEPLLAPLRYLFRWFASLQPALAGMLSKLTELVDTLTSGVAELLTGPGSLQAISDAIQSVVDTLRNIDIGFLREALQALYIQLLDELEALNPAQLGEVLDAAFASLLDTIDLDLVIPPGAVDTLDTSYDSTLDKLRALDPEELVTAVVQPEYEATVVPLVDAFDLTPLFDALIEFLRGLAEELGGEMDRVNTAYQGLRAARPSLGSINVNVSF